MADILRAEEVDCRRRGKDRRAREKSGELRSKNLKILIWVADGI